MSRQDLPEVGIALLVPYEQMVDVAVRAEELGFRSVWVPEHLIFPAQVSGSPHPAARSPRPDTPTFDVMVFLAAVASATDRIRLGTWVYNLALRHPLVVARAAQTLDHVSGGRLTLGVGAGWLEGEYEAAGVDFATRGSRLDECIDALRELWSQAVPSFAGQHVQFPDVVFEPKPVQQPIPIHVGGESPAALRRAATHGDGWLGMGHTPESAAEAVATLRRLREDAGRADQPFEVTVGATPTSIDDLARYGTAGVDRVIATPWRSAADALAGLDDLAARTRQA